MCVLINKTWSSLKSATQNILHPKDSLKWKTIQSSIVVIGADALSNIIRLAGNLIMTRLLFPEAFGLMLIVTLVQTALGMLSDAGVRDAVIVKSRGREEVFVNTAWVIMITRGIGLFILSLILAWPISVFYDQPILMWLIAINGIAPLFDGFSNPNRFIYERDIRQLQVASIDLVAQTLALVIGITILFFYPSVWVLVLFGIQTAMFKCILSYKLIEGERPKFKVDKGVFKEIFNIGKWIVFATALTFLASQGDRVLVSKLMTIELLGIFSVAIALAKIVETVAANAATKLLMPVYAAIDQKDSEGINEKSRNIKLGFAALFMPPVLFFCIFGQWLIELMYDDRYLDAGWMLQIMAMGALFAAVTSSLSPVILGKGHVKVHLTLYVVKVLIYFFVLLSGNYFYGVEGIVAGIAIAPMIIYFVYSGYVMRYGIYAMKYDIPIFMLFLGIVFVSWYYRGWPIVLG